MSLNSLSSLGSLASTAYGTAKSTFKAISDAAVTPDGDGDGAAGGTRKPPVQPPALQPAEPTAAQRIKAAQLRSAEAKPAEKPLGRVGTKLDAYA